MHSFLANLPDMSAELDRLLGQIPRGRVTTYGDIAEALGDVKAARWVAEALNCIEGHWHSDRCSCHRVIRKTGELGGYISDETEKVNRLLAEKVIIRDGKVDLSCRWSDFVSAAPLRQLAALQDEIAVRVQTDPIIRRPKLVAGVDAAFVGECIISTCVTLSFPELEKCSEWSHVAKVAFPYIPGYLAFRELPALWELWQRIGETLRPDLVIVDGNGRLHPRRAGIASCFGVMTGVSTIGIGKSLLCGRVDHSQALKTRGSDEFSSQPVLDEDEWLADCITRKPKSKPIYASIGHLIDLKSLRVLLPQLFLNHRLPEPVYQADRLSKVVAKQVRQRSLP